MSTKSLEAKDTEEALTDAKEEKTKGWREVKEEARRYPQIDFGNALNFTINFNLKLLTLQCFAKCYDGFGMKELLNVKTLYSFVIFVKYTIITWPGILLVIHL